MLTSTDSAITDWLAHSHERPSDVCEEWAHLGVALLPLGHRFDAVRIHTGIVRAAAGSDEWPLITECLGEALAGPVIHDPRGEFYALVPPQTTETWSSPLARCLGRGAWVGVPRVDQNALQFGPYWSVPMERAGELCSSIAVAELVRLGHERLTSGAR